MSISKFGFVYLWFDRKRKMYYIGSHWGAEDDGYICSSQRMKDAYHKRSDEFKRRILKRIYTNRADLLNAEQKYLDSVKNKNRYYNLHWNVYDCWWSDDDRYLTVSEKISKSKKGKRLPEETIRKSIEANTGAKRTDLTRSKISASKKGKARDSCTRDKISKSKMKTYTFVSPEGEIRVINNLIQFCKDNKLDYSSMSSLHRKSYHKDTFKGWSIPNNG